MISLPLLRLSVKTVFYSLLILCYSATMYGVVTDDKVLLVPGFAALFLIICLFTDRRKAVADQTTNMDIVLTGTMLRVLLPVATSYIAAYAILIADENPNVWLVTLLSASMFLAIRYTSFWFERKGWKLSLDECM